MQHRNTRNGLGLQAGAAPTFRVLVVDDCAAQRELASAVFAAIGWQVSTAEDGFEAARKAASTRFDLILMDRRMPRCDGDLAVRLIRLSGGLSAMSTILSHSTEPPVMALAIGYDGVVSKPVRIADLFDTPLPEPWIAGNDKHEERHV